VNIGKLSIVIGYFTWLAEFLLTHPCLQAGELTNHKGNKTSQSGLAVKRPIRHVRNAYVAKSMRGFIRSEDSTDVD